MSPDQIRALAAAINTGATAEACHRSLGLPSRNAALGAASRLGFGFGKPVTPEMLERALAPKPQRVPRPQPQRTPPMDEDSPIHALACQMLDEHRITQNALPPMLDLVLTEPALLEAVISELVEGVCRRTLDAVLQERYNENKRQTGGGPLAQRRLTAQNLAGHAQAVANSLLDDFRLPNGKKLGDATRPDLATAMASYQITAQDAEVKRRWLQLVMQSVTPGKTVRECINAERAAELREEARKVEA